MKRDARLVEISRREFCALAGCLGLAVTACGSDAPSGPDARGGSPDAGTGATCGGVAAVDVGPPSTFVMNTPALFGAANLYVVRDSGGLYAVSSRCTHQGGQNNVYQGHFVCPLHGAEFDYAGNVLVGPATVALSHYGMCVLANGHVGVTTSQRVSQATRLVA